MVHVPIYISINHWRLDGIVEQKCRDERASEIKGPKKTALLGNVGTNKCMHVLTPSPIEAPLF